MAPVVVLEIRVDYAAEGVQADHVCALGELVKNSQVEAVDLPPAHETAGTSNQGSVVQRRFNPRNRRMRGRGWPGT